jgi:hypothetical protein
MTLPKTREPLESFGPELLEILLRAAKGESITLSFPTAKMAHTFRRRLYTLRRRLADERPEEYKIVCRAEVGPVTQPDEEGKLGPLKPATVTLRLKDSEFKEIIAEAKTEKGPITAPALEADPIADLEPQKDAPNDL